MMIDDDFYNRQRYVLGEEAMKMVTKSAVFLCGLSGGAGVEIAKNVALAGVHVLTFHDLNPAATFDAKDLCTNFYASERTENRLQKCVSEVSKLNPYVTVNALTDPDEISMKDLAFLKRYFCVILVNEKEEFIERVDNFCHDEGIRFISVNVRGVFSRVFVDFGDAFVVTDKDGEECKEVRVESTSFDGTCLTCKCFSGQRHDLESGDSVRFRSHPESTYKITTKSPFEFTIDCESSLVIPSGDTATQVKNPQTLHYERYSNAKNSKLMFSECDESKSESIPLIHAAFQVADKFEPRPWNESDCSEFVKMLAASCGEGVCSAQKTLVDAYAHTCACEFQPLSAFVGGVVGQEVIKAISGKFTPIQQWLYADMREVVPLSVDANCVQSGSAVDNLASCIGLEAAEKVRNAKLFMVGAGAIGCELLKNFAMNGFATGDEGKLTITDPDLIEKSNLNRQFLFRTEDIRKPKSVVSADVALKMNPSMHIEAKTDKVCPETESIFDDQFFESLDMAVNALDNVAARRYMDSRCVNSLKPLLESGTLGTKGHVQVIVPFLTENYDSQQDPPEKDTPFCTIHSFPTSIDHCIQWARDIFEEYFVSLPNKILEGAKECGDNDDGSAEDAEMVKKIADVQSIGTYDGCVNFAISLFGQLFSENIDKLLKEHPDDTEEGKLFWAPPKYKPQVVEFNPECATHDTFVKSFASILFSVLGLHPTVGTANCKKKPKTSEEATNPSQNVVPAVFEKDDDTNHHIDFIWAAASVRAENYGISSTSRLEVKRIAGKIIPAIATTTAAVSGLVTCEIIKVLQKPATKEALRNTFLNLGISLFSFSQPAAPLQVRVTDTLYETVWDSWSYRDAYNGPKLSDFISFFEKKLGLTLVALSQGPKVIYNKAIPFHKTRPGKALSSLVNKGNGASRYVLMSAGFLDQSNNPVQTPPIKYFF